MGIKTWTKYKLTDQQVRFLSQIVNNRQYNFYGPTLDVLERNGLIEAVTEHGYVATDLGRQTLLKARREGW